MRHLWEGWGVRKWGPWVPRGACSESNVRWGMGEAIDCTRCKQQGVHLMVYTARGGGSGAAVSGREGEGATLSPMLASQMMVWAKKQAKETARPNLPTISVTLVSLSWNGTPMKNRQFSRLPKQTATRHDLAGAPCLTTPPTVNANRRRTPMEPPRVLIRHLVPAPEATLRVEGRDTPSLICLTTSLTHIRLAIPLTPHTFTPHPSFPHAPSPNPHNHAPHH